MLDLGSAIVLGLVLVGLVSLARSLAEGDTRARINTFLTLAVAIIAVQLVAASDFASEQVVLNRPLNSMNFWSQLVVGVILAGAGSAAWQGFQAVKNIGENQPETATFEDLLEEAGTTPEDFQHWADAGFPPVNPPGGGRRI